MRFTTSALPNLRAFALANDLHYAPVADPPDYGGALFGYLQNARLTDRFNSNDCSLEVGAITGTVGGSQSSTDDNTTVTVSLSTTSRRSYGYLAMRLNRSLPHLVLDATRNDRTFGSSIPMPIAGGQTLSLEGNFDQHFTLHCPNGYERDALYVFTPDLMALLIDETGDLDVEIVDDMLFVYANEPFDLTDAAVWQRLHRIRTVVGMKTLRQTGRYSDDRVGVPPVSGAPNTVGESGQRLQQGFLGAAPKNGFGKVGWLIAGVFVGVLAIIGVVGFTMLSAVWAAFGR